MLRTDGFSLHHGKQFRPFARRIATTQAIPIIQLTAGKLTVKLNALEDETIFSRIEIIREVLKIGDVPIAA